MLHHKIKELSCLLRQFMVHLLRLRNHFRRRSLRHRISFRENQLLIVIMQLVHAEPFLLLLPKFQAERHNFFLHLRTELRNILRRVIVSSIAEINKLNIRRKSQLLRNFIAQRNHLVIQRIEISRNLLIQISPRRHRLFPHLTVRALHRFQQSIKITRLSPKLGRSIRRNFAVLLCQIRLFNQILHNTVVSQFLPNFHILHKEVPKLPGKLFDKRRLKNHLLRLLHQQPNRRNRLIPELNLPFIKRIPGIHRISHLRHFRHRRPDILALLLFHKKPAQLLIRLGIFQSLSILAYLLLLRLHIQSYILNFRKLLHLLSYLLLI